MRKTMSLGSLEGHLCKLFYCYAVKQFNFKSLQNLYLLFFRLLAFSFCLCSLIRSFLMLFWRFQPEVGLISFFRNGSLTYIVKGI